MGNQLPLARKARLAGFLIVLALHAAALYSLWHYRVLPPPAETATLFVSLFSDAPRPRTEPPRPSPPRPHPARPEQLIEPPPPLAAQNPVALPAEPAVPAPPVTPPKIEAPAEPPAPPKPAGPMVLGGELAIVCPERVPPAYPALSRRLGEEGKVVVRVELSESGRIDQAVVKISSGHARLDEAALNAVRQWRCNPAMRDGVAIRAVALQPFNFVLEGR